MSKTKGQRVHEFTIRVTFDGPVKDFVALNEVRGNLKDADFYTENGCNAGKFIIKAVKKAPPLVIERHPAPQPTSPVSPHIEGENDGGGR